MKSKVRLEKYINFSLISNCIIFNTLAGCKGKDKKGGKGCCGSGKDKETIIADQSQQSAEELAKKKKEAEEKPDNQDKEPGKDGHDDDNKDKPDNGNAEFNVKLDNIKLKFKNLQDKNNQLPEGFKYDFAGKELTDTELNNIKNLKQIDEFDKKIDNLETEHRNNLIQKIDKINSDREKMEDYVVCPHTGNEFNNSVKSCNIDNVVEISNKIKKEEEKNKDSLNEIKTYYLEKIEKIQKADTENKKPSDFYEDKKDELKKIEDINDFKNLESDFNKETTKILIPLNYILEGIIKNLDKMNNSKIIDCKIITKENLEEFNNKASEFKNKEDNDNLKELDRLNLEELESATENTLKDYKKYISESITDLNNCCEKVNNLIDRHNYIITKILNKTDGEIDKLNTEINEDDITCTFVKDKKIYFSNQEKDINKKISEHIVVLNEKIEQKNELVSLLKKLKYDVTGLEFKKVSKLEEITNNYVTQLSTLSKKLDESYTNVNGKLNKICKDYKCDKKFYFFTIEQIIYKFDTFKSNFNNFLEKGFSFDENYKDIDNDLTSLKGKIDIFILWYEKYKVFEFEGVKFNDSEEIQQHVKELKEIVKKIEERDYLHLESKRTLEEQYENACKCFNNILEKLSENFKFKYNYRFKWCFYEYSDNMFKETLENVTNNKFLYYFKINSEDRFIFKENKSFFNLYLNNKKNLVFTMYYINKKSEVKTRLSYYSKNKFTTIPKLEDILNEEFCFGKMNYIVKLKDLLRVLDVKYASSSEYECIMLKSKNYDGVKILLNSNGDFYEKNDSRRIIDIDNNYKFKKDSYDTKYKFAEYYDLDNYKPYRNALNLKENYQEVINNENLELDIDSSDVFVKDLSIYDTKGLDFDKIYNDITDKLEIKD